MRSRLILLVAVLTAGCSADSDTGGPGGKADDETEGSGYPIILERATAQELADQAFARLSPQLDACFAAYKNEVNPDAVMITSAFLGAIFNLSGPGCDDWS